MSFKRDGNDSGALNNQRQRRVADLLCEDIDDDELIKLRKGKFACKLCYHRPVFDTVNMFYVHKQGKKHLASMEYAAQEKQKLADLITKRNHEQQAASNQLGSQTQTSSGSDKRSFIPDVKRQKTRPFDRKKVVLLDTCNESGSTVTMATNIEQLPGNRGSTSSLFQSVDSGRSNRQAGSMPTSNCNNSGNKSGNSRSSELQKNSFRKSYNGEDKNRSSIFGNKQMRGCSQPGEAVIGIKNVHKFVGNLKTEQRNKFYLSRKNQQKEIWNDIRSQLKSSTNSATTSSSMESDTSASSPYQTWDYYKNLKGGHVKVFQSKKDGKTMSANSTVEKSLIPPNSSERTSLSSGTNINTDRSAQAEKMLQAFGSGWKKDWTGQWVKDEEAEFDTDEEEPNI